MNVETSGRVNRAALVSAVSNGDASRFTKLMADQSTYDFAVSLAMPGTVFRSRIIALAEGGCEAARDVLAEAAD